jgi:hypothetical protein
MTFTDRIAVLDTQTAEDVCKEYNELVRTELSQLNSQNIASFLQENDLVREPFELVHDILASKHCQYNVIKDAVNNYIDLAVKKDSVQECKNYANTEGTIKWLQATYPTRVFTVPEQSDPEILKSVPKDTVLLAFKSFNNGIAWKDLKALDGCQDLQVLHLGHDGVIYGGSKDIKWVLDKLPSLQYIVSCAYYTKCENALEKAVGKRCITIHWQE